MKRTLLIALNVICWGALVAYLVVSSRYTSSRKGTMVCERINVSVLDSAERDFITSGMVRMWLSSGEMKVLGRDLSSVNTRKVSDFITRRGYVKNARVYTTLDGALNVELTQRAPLVRFNTSNGYNFYFTDDGFVVPAQRHAVEYVPLVTGSVDFPFASDFIGYFEESIGEGQKKVSESYLFLSNLINFVKFVRDSDFWSSFIVQINVAEGSGGDREPQVEIVPRIGSHIVNLGSVDGYEEKLSMLMDFYKGASAYEGWDRYRYINLKYKGQVVCIK